MTLLALGQAAAVLLGIQIALAAVPGASDVSGDARTPPPARTIKERLGDKASDDQRVNNCKVPLALRGPKPRSDNCRDSATPAPTQ